MDREQVVIYPSSRKQLGYAITVIKGISSIHEIGENRVVFNHLRLLLRCSIYGLFNSNGAEGTEVKTIIKLYNDLGIDCG